eukprot:10787985-Alexandrium_andersonii.AAC.1
MAPGRFGWRPKAHCTGLAPARRVRAFLARQATMHANRTSASPCNACWSIKRSAIIVKERP